MKTLTFFEFERHTAEQKQYGALEDALFAYYDAGYGIDRYFLEDGPFPNEMAERCDEILTNDLRKIKDDFMKLLDGR